MVVSFVNKHNTFAFESHEIGLMGVKHSIKALNSVVLLAFWGFSDKYKHDEYFRTVPYPSDILDLVSHYQFLAGMDRIVPAFGVNIQSITSFAI